MAAGRKVRRRGGGTALVATATNQPGSSRWGSRELRGVARSKWTKVSFQPEAITHPLNPNAAACDSSAVEYPLNMGTSY